MNQWLQFLLIAACLGLGFYWARSIGPLRGMLAGVIRLGWVLPIVWSLQPETITEKLPNTLVRQPIHVFVDDSASMRGGKTNGNYNEDLAATLDDLEKTCLTIGCFPKLTKLSDTRPEVKTGFTPLGSALEPWLFRIGSEPWILLSDGADSRPASSWNEQMQGRGGVFRDRQQGLIVGFGKPAVPGYWLEDLNFPSFAFEGRTTRIEVVVVRAEKTGLQTVQVQASIDGQPVISTSAVFADGALEARAELAFATPARGPHLVQVKSLPVNGEKDIWDNEIVASIDVLPNTIGVLHLLGAPSWDGRFLRRYLKSEPKFDLISFFILRDPWDSQQVSERELSLIPFPVERLFKEELSSFRVLVIQNFTMQQFLQPEYQENLVKFVKDGGGLFFIGGPRALTENDIVNSPIAEILPFTVDRSSRNAAPAPMDFSGRIVGGTYDSKTQFSVDMADPPADKRALANVYDDWERLSPRLTNVKTLRGLHSLNGFKFKNEAITPLLNARIESGVEVPLAVASYPGKGRAIWLFSDTFWRLAQEEGKDRSRFDYQEFIDGAITWLMRNDRRPSLTVGDFRVESLEGDETISWQARLSGPASRYVGSKGSEWSVSVCGQKIIPDQMITVQQGGEEWILSGVLKYVGRTGRICTLKIQGDHAAFGQVSATAMAQFSEKLADSEMSPSPRKLAQLAKLTGGKYVGYDEDRVRIVGDWLRQWTKDQSISLPNRFKTIREFYWPQSRSWIWLVLILVPLEVVVRRWKYIV